MERQEIVRRLERSFALADQIKARLTTSQRQMEAHTSPLFARAFSGIFLPKASNDEVVSYLLPELEREPELNPKLTAMSKLTPELQLEIAKTVEDRFAHLPAETLKLIQQEVDERVKQSEEHYKRLFNVVVVCLGLLLAGFFGVTWNSVASRVNSLMTDTEVKRKLDQIDKAYVEILASQEKVRSSAAQIQDADAKLRTRLTELHKMDNVVTYDTNGDLTVRAVNSQIRIMPRALNYQDSYCTLRFNPQTGGIEFETSAKGSNRVLQLLQ